MIVVLVEGPGDRHALPILVQRAGKNMLVHPIDMRGKSNMIRRNRGFEDTIRRRHALGGRSFIVLMDGDVTSAPYHSLEEERRDMRRRAQALAAELQVSVQVRWAVLEMESWLVGGIQPGSTYCGLRGVGQVPTNTEAAPPDPKSWLEDHLVSRECKPRTQQCLATRIDMEEAQRRNRSMRVFLDDIER
jgi:hypothetical protein